MTRRYIIYQDLAEPPSLEVPSCASWMPPLHQPDPAHWTRRWSMAALTAVVMAYGAPEISTPVTGTMAVTEAADTAASSGTVEWVATMAATDAADTAAMSGNVISHISWLAPLAEPVLTPRKLTPEGINTVFQAPLAGDLGVTEAADTAAFSGAVTSSKSHFEGLAQAPITDGPITIQGEFSYGAPPAVRDIAWFSPLSSPVLLPRQLTRESSALPWPVPLTGDVAATEAADTAAFSGTVAGTIALDWYTQPFLPVAPEGTLVVGGYVLIGHEVSNVAWLQQLAGPVRVRQTLLLQGGEARYDGIVPVTGTMAVTEVADTAAASGTVEWIGTLAATDGQDAASFDGDVIVIGNLSATDAIDTASMSGTVFALPVTGTMSVTDTIDAAAVSGAVAWGAAMAATEASDTAAFDGDIITIGNMAASEPQDQADFRAPGARYVPNYTKTVSMSRLPLRTSYRWSGRRRGR